jgi:hypothetical protein
MSNLREAYAATATASLEWSEQRERAIDRVAAAGLAPRLGMDLWRARYQLSLQSFRDAHQGLVQLYQTRYKSETTDMACRIVDEALSEFMGPACTSCNGAREMILDQLKIVCTTCEGSGLRRYSNFERARRMQVSMRRVETINGKLAWLAGEMGSLDKAVNTIIAAELERD